MPDPVLLSLLEEKSTGVLHLGGARMALLDVGAGFWSIRRQLEALVGDQLTDTVLQQSGANGGASFAELIGLAQDIEENKKLFTYCVQAYQTAGFGKFEIREIHWPIGRVVI